MPKKNKGSINEREAAATVSENSPHLDRWKVISEREQTKICG
jgi:hypothetical protein